MFLKKALYLLTTFFLVFICSRVYAIDFEDKIDMYNELNYQRSKVAYTIDEDIKDYYDGNYPEYYGGIYLEGEKRNIIILVVTDLLPSVDSEEYMFFSKIINSDSSIRVEKVANSLNTLTSEKERLNKKISLNKINNVKSSYVDIINNKITVKVYGDFIKKSNILYNYLMSNKNVYNIVETYSVNETYATVIKSGEKILFGSNPNHFCSMGFRVKYKGKIGYLTAGHCVADTDYVLSGKVLVKQYANNKKNDYAFVLPYDSYTTSNKLISNKKNYSKLAVVDYCPFYVVGTTIAKDGGRTGYTSGTITSLDSSIYYDDDNYTINGLITATLYSYKGDSGAPIFIPRTDSSGGSIAIGILNGGDGTSTFFTGINNLPSSLQKRV